MRCKRVVACLMAMLLPAVAGAADWPQWRGPQRNGVAESGPQRNGVAESGPPLATTWPDGGPKRVWLSEDETLGGKSSDIVRRAG